MSVVIKDNSKEFKEETWGKKVNGEDVIDGYKFRGRQPFKKAKEKLEKLLVRGTKFDVGNINCTVLDVRNKGIENEVDIEMNQNEKDGRGVAVIKMYGPNKKKENVVLVTKYKQSDIKFVALMAKNVIRPLITKFLDVEKEEKVEISESDNKCEYCASSFNTKRGLKGHITKKHRNVKDNENMTIDLTGDTEFLPTEKTEKVTDDETSFSEEELEVKEEKKYTSKCIGCKHAFETTRKYEIIKQLKEHKKVCLSPPKHKQKYCVTCGFKTKNEQHLKRHNRDKHDELTASTSPPPKKSKVDIKQSQEGMDMDIDEQNDMDMEIDQEEFKIRSKRMDQKIEAKAIKLEEEEKRYQEKKKVEIERKKEKEALEHHKRKLSIKQNKQKIKDEKRKSRKKNEIKNNELKNIPNVKPLPKNIAHLCNEGDMVYVVPGDGACGPNSISAHLFRDEVFGPKLRRKINDFKVEHWDRKYKLKTQCTVDSPYVRRIGSKGNVVFTNPEDLFEFIKNADDSEYMWTDCEDLVVVADMFQVKIKVITMKGENDENPTENWIYPDDQMKEFAELTDVKIDDIVLLHENDTHFNLIIDKDNDLAKVGSLSFMTNMGPLMSTREPGDNNDKEKTYVDVVVNGSKDSENPKDEVERLKKDLQKITDKNKALEVQYEECVTALRKSTEESEKLKSELKDLKLTFEIEKEIEKTPSKTSQAGMDNKNTSCLENLEPEVEEEFNCIECDFQGTQQSQLSKHILIRHRIKCRNCESIFKNKPEFMVHRKKEHYNAVAVCLKGANCVFLDRCWWKHKKENANEIECYYCEETFATKAEVMFHRKTKHPKTVKNCSKFANKNCPFNETTCWFKHEANDAERNKNYDLNEKDSVFRKRQDDLKSP